MTGPWRELDKHQRRIAASRPIVDRVPQDGLPWSYVGWVCAVLGVIALVEWWLR
jgi:hypothetical protein